MRGGQVTREFECVTGVGRLPPPSLGKTPSVRLHLPFGAWRWWISALGSWEWAAWDLGKVLSITPPDEEQASSCLLSPRGPHQMPKSRTATTPQLKLGVDFQPNLETDMAASSYPTFSQQIPSVWSSPYPPSPWNLYFVWLRVRVRIQRHGWVNLEEIASFHSLPTLHLDLPSET